jgi:hypothetical protein
MYLIVCVFMYSQQNIYNSTSFWQLVGTLAYYARGRGFDSRTAQTFVCMNKSVCIGSGCFYV